MPTLDRPTTTATRKARRALRPASPTAPVYSLDKMSRILHVGGDRGGWIAQRKRPQLPENNPDLIRTGARLPSPWEDIGRQTTKEAAAMRANVNLAQVPQ